MVSLRMRGSSIPLATDLRLFGSLIPFWTQKYKISLQDFVLCSDTVFENLKFFFNLTGKPIRKMDATLLPLTPAYLSASVAMTANVYQIPLGSLFYPGTN